MTIKANLETKLSSIKDLHPYQNNARIHNPKQVSQIARSIQDFGFNNPILIDGNNVILAGHGRWLAAKELGMTEVPTICLDHMTELEKRAYILADNRLADKAGWDQDILKIELQNIQELDINADLTITGFETPEIDLIFNAGPTKPDKDPQDAPVVEADIPSRVTPGDLWQLDEHILFCGDSTKEESFAILMEHEKAHLVITDPPYNVCVDGHVGGKGNICHSEFAFASGKMSPAEFTEFLSKAFKLLTGYSVDGSIHFIFMDWRHLTEITTAAQNNYTELKNLCVWNKQLGGMGSLYRSQHELIFVYKNGATPHINNIALGKYGRNRTNVWDYPGIHVSNNHRHELKLHPTVKPVQMISDAIIDCSNQGDLVLDCFAGSGSTLLAAQRVRRRARVIEYEPKYCDVILYRFEQMTGIAPIKMSGGANV